MRVSLVVLIIIRFLVNLLDTYNNIYVALNKHLIISYFNVRAT